MGNDEKVYLALPTNGVKLKLEAPATLEVKRWTFDLPEADQCLLASGDFDVNLF